MVTADTFHCANCGGDVDPGQRNCTYCGSVVASVLCVLCGKKSPPGSTNCNACGELLAPPVKMKTIGGACPRCDTGLDTLQINDLLLDSCSFCDGVFLGKEMAQYFMRKNTEKALRLPQARIARAELDPDATGYLKCPVCREFMSRTNFGVIGGTRSGVIIDVCRLHGTWFDAGEMENISRFIRTGGLLHSPAKTKDSKHLRGKKHRQLNRILHLSPTYEKEQLDADSDLGQIAGLAVRALMESFFF